MEMLLFGHTNGLRVQRLYVVMIVVVVLRADIQLQSVPSSMISPVELLSELSINSQHDTCG